MVKSEWDKRWEQLNDRLITVSATASAIIGVGAGLLTTNAMAVAGFTKSMTVAGSAIAGLSVIGTVGYATLKLSENYVEKQKDKVINERVDNFLKICPQYKGQEEQLHDWEKMQLILERPFTLETLTNYATAYAQSMAKTGEDFDDHVLPFTGRSLNDIKIMDMEQPYSFMQYQHVNECIADKNVLKDKLGIESQKESDDKHLYKFAYTVSVEESNKYVPVKDKLTYDEKASLYKIYTENYDRLTLDTINLCNRNSIVKVDKAIHDFDNNVRQELVVDNKYVEQIPVKTQNANGEEFTVSPKRNCEINFGGHTYYLRNARVESLDNGTSRISFLPQDCTIDPVSKYRTDIDESNTIGYKRPSAFTILSLQVENEQHPLKLQQDAPNISNVVEIGLVDSACKPLLHGDLVYDLVDGKFGVLDASKDKDKFGDTPTFINLYDMSERPLTSPLTSRFHRLGSFYEIQDKAYGFIESMRKKGVEDNIDLVLKRIDVQALELRDKPNVNLRKKLIHSVQQEKEVLER